ncbi:putative ABC transporter ATP-binding protein YhcG [Bacillus sp. J14TS2]|uniref:ABC transporter ATP-binding protein n=1 Tax=Bacillus sp. J14TS2 TaxID=2807188 RepID=UPI001B06856E|nr:ABC transporter ATP-binding protein [Bacillus sp. J14TS2]GIN72908.1 putative ABC transporter ATP-binding protein YhcG [Bacillus sp. J14TS2]
MNHKIIQFEHVSKNFPGKMALDDVSFELPAGKIIGVIGPNGAGKSTLLKLIAGLLRPTAGKVIVNGKPAQRRISAEVAYLSEQEGSYPFYTVAETLNFYNTVFSDFDSSKAEEMIDFMELDRNQKVHALSKGGKARLKMIAVLSRRAPVVLLDEPLAGLDPMIRDSVIKGLVAFVDPSEQTVVMTTHEVSEIEPALDMVVAIKDGGIVKLDEVENIRAMYEDGLVSWMMETFGSTRFSFKALE